MVIINLNGVHKAKNLGFTVMGVDTCSYVCVSRRRGWGGCVGSILTEVTGAHLLHEAVRVVLHLTLGADLGH